MSIRTAASTPKPWPSSPTSCGGTGRPRRPADSSRTPWPRPTARDRRPPSARAHGSRAMQLMETDLEQADLDCTVCWEHAMASGDPEDIGNAYRHQDGTCCGPEVTCAACSSIARDHYEWSAGQGLPSRGPHAGDRAARRGGPERGRGHRARRSGDERQYQRRGDDPAPRSNAGGSPRRERRGARSRAAGPRADPRPRGAADGRGGSAPGRGVAGSRTIRSGRSSSSSECCPRTSSTCE